MASLTVAVGGAAARDGNLGLLVGSVNPHHEVQRTKEVHNSQVSSDSTESPLRHLRPGGEASLRTPVQLGQFSIATTLFTTVEPNFGV